MYLLALLSIVCGALAASALVIKHKPNAKELLDKLAPYQAGIGAALSLVSLWYLFQTLSHFSVFTAASALGFKFTLAVWTRLACCVIGIPLGFLLAYGLFNKYALSKNPVAAEKGAAVQAKLVGVQIPLGAAGAISGALFLIALILI